MKRLAFIALAAMVLAGCQETTQPADSSQPEFARGGIPGPPESPGPPAQFCGQSLVGTWTATNFTFEGGQNLVEAPVNLVLTVTFMSDGTLTDFVDNDPANLFCDTGTSCTDDGRYIQTDVNLLTCDPHCDEILDYTLSGNTVNISFDGGHEDGHTPFTATFVRTS